MASERRPSNLSDAYWRLSQRPLQSLYFLLPLLLLYEIGTRVYARDAQTGVVRFIYARSLLRDFFELLGVTGYYLPGLIVVIVLLCWHMARRDPWTARTSTALIMWAESLVLALPLFVFMLVLVQHPAAPVTLSAPAITPAFDTWKAQLVFSIGAGIYEELLFRLIAIALLHLVLVDVLALPEHIGAIGAVGLSAIAFAVYHFPSMADFELARGLFYTAAGVYFAGVYVLRGFGIVVATHAAYDVLVVLLEAWQRQ